MADNDGATVTVESLPPAPTQAQDASGSPTPTAPETIAKAEHDRIVADLQHKIDSAMGRVRTNVPDQTLQEMKTAWEATNREVRRLRLESADMEPAAREAELTKLSGEERTAEETRQFQEFAQELANDLNENLETAAFLKDNTQLATLLENWNQSRTRADLQRNYRALNRFIDREKDKRHDMELKAEKDNTEKERKRANQANGTLEAGAPGGTPVGSGSIASYTQRLRKGEALPSAEEIDRMTAAYLR